MAESKKQIKKGQENAKKFDKNFLISVRKKPSRPQNQKFCILKNITRQEIEFGSLVVFVNILLIMGHKFQAKINNLTIAFISQD